MLFVVFEVEVLKRWTQKVVVPICYLIQFPCDHGTELLVDLRSVHKHEAVSVGYAHRSLCGAPFVFIAVRCVFHPVHSGIRCAVKQSESTTATHCIDGCDPSHRTLDLFGSLHEFRAEHLHHRNSGP